jgi:glycosyltransferase involved in cell wall biosynthesis
MRVCLLCVEIFAFGKIGGYGRATRIMGRELARRGIQVFAIVPRRGEQGEVEHLDGITVLSFPMSRPWQVMELSRRCDADIYHSQEPSIATYFAQRSMPHRRHVVTIRDPKSISDWLTEVRRPSVSSARTFLARFYDWNPLVRQALGRADRLFSVSCALAGKAHRLYGLPKPPEFLPSPIALPATEPCKSVQPQVCALGRLDPRKRPELFIELAERFPEVRFVMIGGSHDQAREQSLRRRCAGIANLQLTGFIDQFTSNRLSEILGRSWVLVNTSTREGLPTSFLEGLAHGCALLSELNPDGVVERYGHRVARGDFASGLTRLLADGHWRRLGASGRDYVARHYEQERVIERHLEIYRELIA